MRGLRPPVRGEKAAPGVVLGATFLDVYFMPESGAGGGFILSCPPHSPVSQFCLGISNGIIDSQPVHITLHTLTIQLENWTLIAGIKVIVVWDENKNNNQR